MATSLAKIHFLAMKGKDPTILNEETKETDAPGANAIIIQDYDVLRDKYVYGMIDAGFYDGPEKSQYDKNLLIKYLKAHKIKTLEFVLITHYHADHFGNLKYLLNKYSTEKIAINNLILPMNQKRLKSIQNKLDSKEYDKISEAEKSITDSFNEYKKLYPNAKLYYFGEDSLTKISEVYKIGTGTFTFYNTNPTSSRYETKDNDSGSYPTGKWLSDKFSIVTEYAVQNRKILFTGDIYQYSEMILKDRLSKDYDLIEISHHGSSNANCQAFLEEIIPKDKVCTAIQLRSSSKRSRKALNNYLAFNNPDKYPGYAGVRVYGVYQNFENEWTDKDNVNRGSIVAEIQNDNINYYSRRVYQTTPNGEVTYRQKLIHPIDENNVKVE